MNWVIYPLCALGGIAVAAGVVSLFGGSSTSSTAAPNVPSVMFTGVLGAPGDGNAALSEAVQAMLSEAKIALVDRPNRCTVAVSGEVTRLAQDGTEQISIIWQIHDAEGRALGEVAQVNAVAVGELDGAWGTDAKHAARGARNGIIDIMKRKRAGCA